MKAFFDAIRPAFGGRLTEPQVQGMEALLEAGRDLPLHHMANVLAQVRRETGGHMAPIKETVMASHKDKNPSDATVIARLDRAFKAGRLKHVKTPYWREGWFGRGQIQITHRANYLKFGITDPDQAMDLATSARIAVRGMVEGLFTGRKLGDYRFPEALDARPKDHPRRIVNGPDGSDAEVSRFHREFAAALLSARWRPGAAPAEAPPPAPVAKPAPPPVLPPDTPDPLAETEDEPARRGPIAALIALAIALLAALTGGALDGFLTLP